MYIFEEASHYSVNTVLEGGQGGRGQATQETTAVVQVADNSMVIL